ncbi:MAG: hypothetical protein R3B90_14785 [Planctomycetaceae bacterium]
MDFGKPRPHCTVSRQEFFINIHTRLGAAYIRSWRCDPAELVFPRSSVGWYL